MNDDSDHPKATKDALLDELESIQDLLLDNLKSDLLDHTVNSASSDFDELDDELDTAIPVLEDIVSASENDSDGDPDSLNLDDIFESHTINTDQIHADVATTGQDNHRGTDGTRQESVPLDAGNGEKLFCESIKEGSSNLPSPDEQTIATTENLQHDTAPQELEFLIQELVDEFIPLLEDRLRQRLAQCAPAVIRQLSEKHLKD